MVHFNYKYILKKLFIPLPYFIQKHSLMNSNIFNVGLHKWAIISVCLIYKTKIHNIYFLITCVSNSLYKQRLERHWGGVSALRVVEKHHIKGVGMLHDMVNVVWIDIWNPLIQIKVSVSFILSLNLTWHVIQKKTNYSVW